MGSELLLHLKFEFETNAQVAQAYPGKPQQGSGNWPDAFDTFVLLDAMA